MLFWIKLFLDALFISALCGCALNDWRKRIIPGGLLILMILPGIAQIIWTIRTGASVWPHLIALPLFVPLYLIWTRNRIGGGDVKLLFVICLYLGLWQTALAAGIALVVLLIGLFFTQGKARQQLRQKIALGPPLAIGCAGCMAVQYAASAIH